MRFCWIHTGWETRILRVRVKTRTILRPFNAVFSEITAQMENNPLNEHEWGDLVLVVVKGYRITVTRLL